MEPQSVGSTKRLRLDDLLPKYDVEMCETIVVRAPPATVHDALKQLRPAEMRLAYLLGRIRDLARRKSTYEKAREKSGATFVDLMEDFGWITLSEDPGYEVIVGLAGRFWRHDYGTHRLHTVEAFRDYAETGAAKLVVSYRFVDIPGGTLVRCTTRVKTFGPEAEKRFRRYWRVIKLGAHFTVRSGLRAIRRHAERTVMPGTFVH